MQNRTKKAASKAAEKLAVKAVQDDSDSSSEIPTQSIVIKASSKMSESPAKKTVAPV